MYGQLHEGLRFEIIKAPGVSGVDSYSSLCIAAKSEERRLQELGNNMASLVVANNLHGDFLPVTPHLFIGVKNLRGDLPLSNVLVIVLSVTILLTTAHLSGQRATVEVNLASGNRVVIVGPVGL